MIKGKKLIRDDRRKETDNRLWKKRNRSEMIN
jgi:hypothetical protein